VNDITSVKSIYVIIFLVFNQQILPSAIVT